MQRGGAEARDTAWLGLMDLGRLAIRKRKGNNFRLLRLRPGQETVSGETQVSSSPSSDAPESRRTP